VSEAIYQAALLRLAESGTGAGRLPAPDATARRDNPLCGDDVIVDVTLRDGRVEALAHRVRGCVLCRASAAALAGAAPGRSVREVGEAHASLLAMLRAGAPPPGGAWAELAAFLPVREAKSRQGCVLLPFEALADALARAMG
jgi:nitrogen fixation NifU-like protein